jgi:hypothetical protein
MTFDEPVLERSASRIRLSGILSSLSGRQCLRLGDLVDELGHRGFGALMFIFAVPNIIPTPPGTSAILGAPLLMLTYQLMIGRKSIWLPHSLRGRVLDPGLVTAFVARILPWVERSERLLKPRILILTSPVCERLLGAIAFILALILFLPIPFGNILPAASISLMALGLAERDGVAVVSGGALAVLSVLILALVWSAIYAAIITFFQVLWELLRL